jgi:hypothetical protein
MTGGEGKNGGAALHLSRVCILFDLQILCLHCKNITKPLAQRHVDVML